MKWRKIAILMLLMAVTACHRKARSASSPVLVPSTPVAAAPEPPRLNVPVPVPAVVPLALMEGDSAFDSGDFARAARSYAAYLQSNPQSNGIDRVLFRLGVAQSMNAATPRDVSGNDVFNRLIRDYPESSYVPAAHVILNLRAEIARTQTDVKTRDDKIKQLNDELERLKKIDLDRRRTP